MTGYLTDTQYSPSGAFPVIHTELDATTYFNKPNTMSLTELNCLILFFRHRSSIGIVRGGFMQYQAVKPGSNDFLEASPTYFLFH